MAIHPQHSGSSGHRNGSKSGLVIGWWVMRRRHTHARTHDISQSALGTGPPRLLLLRGNADARNKHLKSIGDITLPYLTAHRKTVPNETENRNSFF